MKKQIIVILFVLLVLFSVASVSAEDNQNNDLAVDDISVSGNTFADISNTINSASPGSTVYLDNGTYTGSSEIVVSKNIVIDGASATDNGTVSILDGQNTTRIFNIVGPYTVTLKNLVLINGIATAQSGGDLAAGGAIYGYVKNSNSVITLTLSNVLFEDNTALEGGAVYIRGRSSSSICKLNADNCTFINNRASNGAGAIYVYNSDVKVSNCNFIDNTALRTNESGYSGGAIFSYGSITVDNCLFENNTGLYGGAILNDQNKAIVSNSRFLANIATTNSGSAIYNYESFADLKVINCSFMYNVANNKGSGIYNYRGVVTIEGSNFTNNTARSSALLFNDGGNITIKNSSFSGNVGTNGSVIYNQNCTTWGILMGVGTLTLENCSLDFNIPINGTEIYNGAVLSLYSSKLNGNYTLIQNYGNLTLENNKMTSGDYLSIYNDGGVFINPIKAIVLDNSTVKAFINQTVTIKAVLLDLDNNTIGDTSFRFMVTGPKANPVIYKNGTYMENASFSKSGIYPVGAAVSSNGDKLILENGTIEVLPQPNLKVSANDIVYSDNVTVDVASPDLTSDVVGVIIKNIKTNETVFNGSLKVNDNLKIPDLDVGNYTVMVNFTGNDQYSPVDNSTTFEVSKIGANVSIDISDKAYSQTVNGTVNLTDANGKPLNGTVTIAIGNWTINATVIDGKANFTVSEDLLPSNYTATVKFNGSENYLNSTNSTTFKVNKLQSKITIDVTDTEYNHAIEGTLKLRDSDGNPINGTVKVTIGNLEQTVDVIGGEGKFTFTDVVAPGNYTANATFEGSNIYLASSNTTNFTVSKIDSTLTITVPDIKVLDNITGEVSLKDVEGNGLNGTVAITIGNLTTNVTVTDGKGSFTINQTLVSGNYTATGLFNGSEIYKITSNTTNFTVSKINTIVEIDIPDSIRYDNITGYVYLKDSNGNPLNGTVNVTIEDNTFQLNVTDGVANFTFDAVRAGIFNVSGIYAGNWIYASSKTNTTFEVGKIRTMVDITIPNVTYGHVITGTILLTAKDKTVVSSNVSVTIDGENFTVNVIDGIGNFVFDKILPVGDNYQANVTFDIADDKYYSSTGSTRFNVTKQNSTLTVAIENTTYGEDVVGNITLVSEDGSNITANVTISVNGENITVPVIDGVGNFTISNLNAGEYNLTVNYAGGENYNPTDVNGSFNVAKAMPRLVIVVDNITYGDVAICKIYLGNATEIESMINAIDLSAATVNVTVDGKSYELPLNNGYGVVKVPNLNVGNYTASVSFDGDENYLPADNSTIFQVTNATPLLNISMENITYGDVVRGNITVLGVNSTGLNGTVEVTINNKTYNVTVVDGKGTIEVDSILNPGSYSANGTFSAPNYAEVANSTVFTVTPINITVSNVTVAQGSEGKVNITLSKPLNQTVEVSFNNKTYNVDCIDGLGVLTVPADTLPGNYNVVANLANQTAEGFVNIVPVFNITLNKTADKTNVNLSDEVTFTITVKNNGPGSYNVTINDLIDSSKFQFVSANPTTGNYNPATGIWTIKDLGSNQTESLKLTVKAIAIGNCTNTVDLAIDGFNFTLSANATVLVLNKTNPESNVTNNTNSIEKQINTEIGGLKTANPIFALIFALLLIPLRRKFNS